MIVNGCGDFFSRGIDFVALLRLGLRHLGQRVELSTRFLTGSVLLSGLLGGALLSRSLVSSGPLAGRCLSVDRDSLLCAFHARLCCFGTGLRGLSIGDGFDAVGLFTFAGLGLLQLPLGGQ